MGSYLARAYGPDYLAIAATFESGRYAALDATRSVADFAVEPAPAGFAEEVLALAGSAAFLLDLRRLPADGPVHEWFAARRPMHFFGAVGGAARGFGRVELARDFDALIFVARSTPVRVASSR
jgi:erythromycin esterase-like protein